MTPRRSFGQIEPLEARIAPATILIGAKAVNEENINDTEYVDHNAGLREGKTSEHAAAFNQLNFVDILNGSVNGVAPTGPDSIAVALRGDAVGAALTAPHKFFYLRLHAGDSVVAYAGGYNPDNPLISVTAGDVIAVFTDSKTDNNSENEYDPGEFTGLILGPGAKVQVNGQVNGDIVSALDTHKTASLLDDTLDFSNLVSSTQGISNLKVLGGSVNGSVFSGGSISNLTITAGSVENVYAGTAVNTHSFDFVQSGGAKRFTPSVTYAPGTAGASISNAVFQDIGQTVEAGAGGLGAKGGSLTNFTVNADSDGFALIAGHGGNVGGTKTIGGAGGSLTKINVLGTPDLSLNSGGSKTILLPGNPVPQVINGVMLVAGDGGGSAGANTAVRGGAGGSVSGVTAGIVGIIPANDLSADSFHIYGGFGGNGKTGGAGGSISSSAVVISTVDALGNEIEFIAGSGGTGGVAGVTGGAAGAGGSLTSISASNTYSTQDPSVSVHSSTLIRAGRGGAVLDPSATGGAGGSIKTLSLVGYDSDVAAGSGTDGKSGGKGGSITTLTYTANQSVIAHNIIVNAGRGGDATTLAGGAGGSITGIKAPLVDLETFYINTGETLASLNTPNNPALKLVGPGSGGNSVSGRGGAGGGVTSVDVTDVDKSGLSTQFISGDVLINGGVGGNGGTGGGAGGALKTLRVEGDHFAVAVQAGRGGDATTKGSGGAGGLVSGAFFRSEGPLNDPNSVAAIHPTGSVVGGVGGAGAGAGGRGGAGGGLATVGLGNEGDSFLRAGSGGSGAATVGLVKGGAAGKGGSISYSGVISTYGSGAILAGDAGVGGAGAGAGGSIVGLATNAVNGVRAAMNVTIQAGNGSHGGAGGDISTLGFASTDPLATGAGILGKVLVRAGNGSGEGAVAGRGGNISGLTGVASQVADGTITTLIAAGNGGGGTDVKASGAGGSVTRSTVATGGADGAIIVVEAGNAGNATKATVGGKGGSVIDFGFGGYAAGTVIRSIAAGEGGIGLTKGGAGGSIDQIFAPDNDLGYRTDHAFGYATQGGLFAGTGGLSPKSNGTNGSVTNVVASSISSIVAGARNSLIPHLAEKVANVSVNGSNDDLLLSRNHIFVPEGSFSFTFEGQSTGVLAGRSTNTQVETALNSLSTIQAAGGVTVQYTTIGGYSIKFNQAGDRSDISALEVVTRDVAEAIPNSSLALAFATAAGENGAVALPNVATQPGVTPFGATITLPGSNIFRSIETQVGNDATDTLEIQKIDTASTGVGATAKFTLSFVGDTTSPLPVGASASAVEAALNALPQIIALAGTTQSGGGVQVTKSGTVYTITFRKDGRQPLVSGQAFLQEVERLDLNSIQDEAATTYTLTFNGLTTAPIPFNAGAPAIAAALNNLDTIKATNPNLIGGVTVASAGPGVFDITFTEVGFQSAISGAANVAEIQTVHVVGGALDSFTIVSGDQTTTPLKVGATAEQVEVALNKLPTIISLGGVEVTHPTGADYVIKFNGVGAQALLEANLLQKEKQTVNLPSGATTDYTIHAEYPILVDETHPGQTVDLPFPDGNTTILYRPGDPTAASSTNRVTVQQLGTGSLPEIERIFFGQSANTAALQPGDLFILKYSDSTTVNAQTSNTVVIPYTTDMNALAGLVQNALNSLPLLKGGVVVARDPNTANQILVTYKTNGVQVQLLTETYTPTPHPGGFALDSNYVTATTNGSATTAEIQTLDLSTVVARGGFINLAFAGQQTGFFPTSNNVVTASIAAALNSLSAVGDFGGVNVTEAVRGSHIYTITFLSPGDAPTLTGTAVVPESEQFNVSSIQADLTNEFTLTFRGDSTPVLPPNVSAAVIQAELNKLPSIQALSSQPGNSPASVIVTSTGPGLFRVDFPNFLASKFIGPDLTTPNLPNIVVSSGNDTTHETQHVDLRSLTAYADGLFRLTFGGETTATLPQDATAQDVENALNNLQSIQKTRFDTGILAPTGSVDVVQTSQGEFDVTFNRFGPKSAISGAGSVNTDRFPINVTQTVNGTPATINVGEQVSGAYFNQPVIELMKGTLGSPETQRIDLSTFNGAGLSDFTIDFGGNTTAPLAFTAQGVPPDAAAVQAALNGLTTIPPGGVTVTGSNGVYDVTFAFNFDPASLTVKARRAEVQQFDLGSLYSSTLGEYALTFNGQTTATLPHNATASEVAAALNDLSSVQNAGGVAVQQVGSTPQFNVTFGRLGDQTSLVAAGGLTQETQRINLGELAGRSDATFKLTFNGQTTGALSADLSPSALAAEIQAALNALETINDTRTNAANPGHVVSAIGQVSVTAGENGNFFVTFDARGDVPAISGYSIATTDRVIPVLTTTGGTSTPIVVQSVDGSAGAAEVQTIDLTNLAGANDEFQLQFDNNATDTISAYSTGLLKRGANDAGTATNIQNALNSLPSIASAGGVTVTTNGADSYSITFNSLGNQLPVSGAVGHHETQIFDPRTLVQFHTTTNTTVDGDSGTPEEQKIDITGVKTDFTLQFVADRTFSIPANATTSDIQLALNALSSISSIGGVTVQPVSATEFTVRFNNPGERVEITGTANSANAVYRLGLNGDLAVAQRVGLVDPSNAQAIADLEAVLNELPAIQALRGHDQGTVTVSLVNGSYQIDFNGLGDIPTLTAAGTFSVEPTVDIYRSTDGTASSSVPLPVFEAIPGRAIGPVTTTLIQGSAFAKEVQTVDLTDEFLNGTGAVAFTFNGEQSPPSGTASPNLAADIQVSLNFLTSIQNTAPNGTGSVTVAETAPGSHVFTVTFNSGANQPSLVAFDNNNPNQVFPVTETSPGTSSILEVQDLDLNGLPSANFQVQFGGATAAVTLNGIDQAANAAIIESALDNLGTITDGVTVTSNADASGSGFGTFTISFNHDGNVAQIGATSFPTTESVMGGVAQEIQHIDVSSLQTSNAAGSTFALSYNGEVTVPLSRFATAADVATALNALPQFAATTVSVTGGNGLFDVKFGDTVDHAGLILAQAGNQEVQHLDTSSLVAQGSPSYRLTFSGQQTQPIAEGAAASQVEFALNQLPAITQAGGVTVTQTFDAQNNLTGYDVKFNTFLNQGPITGGVAVHEQLTLNLHNLQNESGFVTFTNTAGGTVIESVPVPTTADAATIAAAINGMNLGNPVTVTQLHPGVFQIGFQNAGVTPTLEGFVSKDGNTVRIPSGASITEIESAIDNVSVSDVTLTGANGLYGVNFNEIGNQVTLSGFANVHEQFRPDIFAGQGVFRIKIGSDTTVDLPSNATGDQIRLALNSLESVKELGGVRSVVVNPDSSFAVTFAGDDDLDATLFVATQNLNNNNIVTTTQGSVDDREVQVFSYTPQGAFDPAKFKASRLVGAIADFNEIDSNRFHFFNIVDAQGQALPGVHFDINGVPLDGNDIPLLPTVSSPGQDGIFGTADDINPFNDGDMPIDGIVMAKIIDSKTINFVPEAALIKNPVKNGTPMNLFIDSLNGRPPAI